MKKLLAVTIIILFLLLTTLIYVLPLSSAFISFNLSPNSGPPGTHVTVSGTFSAGSQYAISFGWNTIIAAGVVSSAGLIPEFEIPILPRGKYNVIITAGTDITASPYPTFTVTPQIFIGTSSGLVGDQINVNGNGFAADQKISIRFDSRNVFLVNTDSKGTFPDTAITIPSANLGNHTISANDASGSSPALNFSISPKITLSPTESKVGSAIKISGFGFTASDKVFFSVDNMSIFKTAATDSNGSFANYELIVPDLSGGEHFINARDSQYNSGKSNLLIKPSITIQTNHEAQGIIVTVLGRGFVSMPDNPIIITCNDIIVITNPQLITVGADGTFSTTFHISADIIDTLKITAKDSLAAASIEYTNIADIQLSAAKGYVGDSININGSGLAADVSIDIKYDDSAVGTSKTNFTGKFTATFQVLPSTTGSHQITVIDQVNTYKFTFEVIPKVIINPAGGLTGKNIAMNGTGFKARNNIIVKFDTDMVTETTTDVNGTFTAMFKVPVSGGGNHHITVTDGVNTITLDFTVDSIVLSAPVLIYPLSLKTSKTPTLDWQDVTDVSGITYSLQISKDATFESVILQKDRLNISEYKLMEQESLDSVSKNAPYYWRVRYYDQANNQSLWSIPSSFYVGTYLPTVIYILIAVGICIIVGFIAYFIERIRHS